MTNSPSDLALLFDARGKGDAAEIAAELVAWADHVRPGWRSPAEPQPLPRLVRDLYEMWSNVLEDRNELYKSSSTILKDRNRLIEAAGALLASSEAHPERLVRNGVQEAYLRDACLDLLRTMRANTMGWGADVDLVGSSHWDRLYDHLTASIGKGVDPVTAIVIEVWRLVSAAAGLSPGLPGVGPHDRGTLRS